MTPNTSLHPAHLRRKYPRGLFSIQTHNTDHIPTMIPCFIFQISIGQAQLN